MAIWVEEGSRGLAHVAMDDFPTFADALFEISDNPLDYRRGRHLDIDITISKEQNLIVVEDRGGEGMDAEGVADWLKWGTGHPHERTDIGQYHKGGKAACGYLADSVVILTRRAGTREVWRFEDRHWKSRREWAVYGEPTPYTGPIPEHLRRLPIAAGFTRLELSDLTDRRYNIEKLRWRIGNTYRRLIADNAVAFRLNGDPIKPLPLPLSSAFRVRDEDIELPAGKRIHVWIGRLNRDAIKGGSGTPRTQGGLRLLYQGRLISDGQYFEHNLGSQGQLGSLIGEADLNHVPPLSNKTGFKESSPEWEEAAAALSSWLAPIIIEFRRAADEHPITREERKLVNEVRREIMEALKQMSDSLGTDGPAGDARDPARGRRPPRRRREHRQPDQGGHHSPPTSRSEAPEDAIGILQRLARRLKKGDEVPPFELDDLDDRSERARSVRAGDTTLKIVINRTFPLYSELHGHPAYVAETALGELLKPPDDDKSTVGAYVDQVNQALMAWWRVARGDSE